jgi:CheY-like chemotaxis protein
MSEPSGINNELLKENAILKQRIQELETSVTDLKRAVEESRSLETKQQHMDKMNAVGTFTRDIANNINNLLMGIQGLAAVSLLDFEPSHPHYENLRKIEEQVLSGVALTNQLLEFAEESRYEVKPTGMKDNLPSSDKEMLKEKIETGAGIIALGTETILLVDDEKNIREVGQKMLESMGYNVYVAASGPEAISIYTEKRNEIALVILDIIMPGMSGGEAYDRLKEINPNVNVLLASGDGFHDRVQEILDRGCNGFIHKPFSFSQFSCKIREMLD